MASSDWRQHSGGGLAPIDGRPERFEPDAVGVPLRDLEQRLGHLVEHPELAPVGRVLAGQLDTPDGIPGLLSRPLRRT
jgi:hypothetical protein